MSKLQGRDRTILNQVVAVSSVSTIERLSLSSHCHVPSPKSELGDVTRVVVRLLVLQGVLTCLHVLVVMPKG